MIKHDISVKINTGVLQLRSEASVHGGCARGVGERGIRRPSAAFNPGVHERQARRPVAVSASSECGKGAATGRKPTERHQGAEGNGNSWVSTNRGETETGGTD